MSEQSGEEKCLLPLQLSRVAAASGVTESFPPKFICGLSDAESANLFLLTTETTREFHVPKFGDLDRWAEPGQRCALQNFILFP